MNDERLRALIREYTEGVKRARIEYRDHAHSNGCSPSHDCHHMRVKRYAR